MSVIRRGLVNLGGLLRSGVYRRGLSSVPDNLREVNDTQQSIRTVDRSREVSGEQHSVKNFSSFEQLGQEESLTAASGDNHQYDVHGNAHLESVMQTNLPEPFSAAEEGLNLKEGIPEGLSDASAAVRGQRWTMNDRLQQSTQTSDFINNNL